MHMVNKSSKKLRKVDGFVHYMKNMDNKAIINSDESAYKEYMEKKTMINTISTLQQQMGELKSIVNNLKGK